MVQSALATQRQLIDRSCRDDGPLAGTEHGRRRAFLASNLILRQGLDGPCQQITIL